MERKRIFRQFQEHVYTDHNLLQDWAQQAIDHIVFDGFTMSLMYTGFAVTKTAQAQVTIAAGRMYAANGAVHGLESATVQSLVANLASATKRYVTISAHATTVEEDNQTRDFIVNVETREAQPSPVDMTRRRAANLTFTAGSESADPQKSAPPSGHVVIAYVLLDTTQVVSVEQVTANELPSLEDHEQRLVSLEAWRAVTEPRINAISSDVAAINNQLGQTSDIELVRNLAFDVARLKELAEIEDGAVAYGADRFLDTEESDIEDDLSQGYDAKVEEGIRFPDANADEFELELFSALDPNASLANGFLLPRYADEFRYGNLEYHSNLGIAQYGFQSVDMVQLSMSRVRVRFGEVMSVCSNSRWWNTGSYNSVTGTFQRGAETFQVLTTVTGRHQFIRLRKIFYDRFTEPYWTALVTNHSVSGAQVAQTFLNPNDMWATKISLYFYAKGGAENVNVSICELANGVPNLERTIMKTTLAHASIVERAWTDVAIPPTLLNAGKRYAIVLVSNANHIIGMSSGNKVIDGTFFYSTDGVYFQGDLVKDMLFKVFGAKFESPQVTIELAAFNLDGGIRYLDYMADMAIPTSTDLILEVRPNGSGEWYPVALEGIAALNAAPPLLQARLRFVGTRDIMAGIKLTGSRVFVARPKTTFVHVSKMFDTGGDVTNMTVKVLLEYFDDTAGGGNTPHDLDCVLVTDPEGTPAIENPDSSSDVVLEVQEGGKRRVLRTFVFTPAAEDQYAIKLSGTTNSAGNTFHVAEVVYLGS